MSVTADITAKEKCPKVAKKVCKLETNDILGLNRVGKTGADS